MRPPCRVPPRAREWWGAGWSSPSGLQCGVQGDVDTGQGLADRAPGLRLLGGLLEPGGVEAVDLAADGEPDAGQLEAARGLVRAEGDVGLYLEGLLRPAGLGDV